MKIKRTELKIDDELSQHGFVRTFKIDMSSDGRPIYREHIIAADKIKHDLIPWWKNIKKRARRK